MLNLRKQNMKYWISEMPIGDPLGGPAFGQRNDPIFTLPLAAQVFIGGVAANYVSNAMSPGAPAPQAPAPAPTVTPPTAMPSAAGAEAKAAERASIAEQLRRRGRASTVLTDQAAGGTTDKLGA